MAITALSLEKFYRYESKYDPDKGKPSSTKFKVKTLDSRVMGYLRDIATSYQVTGDDGTRDMNVHVGFMNLEAVAFGIEWENMPDAGGKPYLCNMVERRLGGKTYMVIDAEALAAVPQAVISELAEEVMKTNQLSEPERKNSDAPSLQSTS